MNTATCVLLNLVSLTQGLISVSTFTRDDFDGILDVDFLVLDRTGKILGPILMSHWVHSGLDEDGSHKQLVDDGEGHGLLLPLSEVTTVRSLTMMMDAFLSMFLSPQQFSGGFDDTKVTPGLPL